MRIHRFILFTVVLFLASASHAADYTPDNAHTTVGFEVTHLMVSTTKGHFNDFSGLIKYDPKAPEKTFIEGTVKVASIDTDNAKRDKHLRSADFFDAEQFPDIKFKSKSVVQNGKKLTFTADFTIKGVTREVTFPVEIRGPVKNPFEPSKNKIGLNAEFVIDRQDFGIRWSKTMEAGGLVVSNDVIINIAAEADSK